MIVLGRDKARMIADIGGAEGARLVLRGRTCNDILPLVSVALKRGCSAARGQDFTDDVIELVKKGLGNAWKWGNRKDPAKSITVEVIATGTGVVAAITDEGDGFEVEGTVGAMRRGDHYFTHGGSGLAHFEKARSLVSYADRGRTVLICCRRRASDPARDPEVMKPLLAAACPCFRDQKATIKSCRIDELSDPEEDHAELGYRLRYRGRDDPDRRITLTGRLLPGAVAERDLDIARRLRDAMPEGGLRIPAPLAALGEPSMAIFECAATKNFRDHAKSLQGHKAWVRAVTTAASGVRDLHRSGIALHEQSIEEVLERHGAAVQRAEARLAASSRPGRSRQLRQAWDRLAAKAPDLDGTARATIHGNLGWRDILYSDRRMYLFRFELSGSAHPGFDVGGFLADSLRFHVLRDDGNRRLHAAGCEAFLAAYFNGEAPSWRERLDAFIAAALLLRLDRIVRRPVKKWDRKVDAFLEQIALLATT